MLPLAIIVPAFATSVVARGLPTRTYRGSLASRQDPEGTVPDDTVDNCTYFATTETADDTCEYLENYWAVTHEDFVSMNPSVKDDCSGIKVGYSYCVEVNNGEPLPTTTTAEPTGTAAPIPSPTREGTTADCDEWYFVEKGDTCSDVLKKFGLNVGQLYEWNSAVQEDCTDLWAEVYVCVAGTAATPTSNGPTPTPTGPQIPSPTQDGTTADCDEWYFVEKGDTCSDVLNKFGLSVGQFYEWNTAVRADCTGLWTEVYVCVASDGTSGTPVTTITAPPTGPTPPSLTQPGIVEDCQQWFAAETGDTCSSIFEKYLLTQEQFTAWNPAVGDKCTLWSEYSYCIGTKDKPAIPITTATITSKVPDPTGCASSPPSPTQPGAICECKKWHKVQSGDSCWLLGEQYGVTEQNLRDWNPGVDCNLWADYYTCVGA